MSSLEFASDCHESSILSFIFLDRLLGNTSDTVSSFRNFLSSMKLSGSDSNPLGFFSFSFDVLLHVPKNFNGILYCPFNKYKWKSRLKHPKFFGQKVARSSVFSWGFRIYLAAVTVKAETLSNENSMGCSSLLFSSSKGMSR